MNFENIRWECAEGVATVTVRRPEKLNGTVTLENKGSSSLPPWKIDPESLPPWLSVEVTGNGKSQTFVNTVTTAGLEKGVYHTIVRADNVEPVSGLPMSAFYYDVDLEVAQDVPVCD